MDDAEDVEATLESERFTDAAEAIEDKPGDAQHGLGSQSTHLAAGERVQFVNRLAVMAEHARRLAEQVQQLGKKPCVEPPPREVIVKPGTDPSIIANLQAELRVAASQIEEHVRQKAALRVQVNLIAAQRDDAQRRLEAEKSAPQPAAPTRPAPVAPTAGADAMKNRVCDLVLVYLRGRASSASIGFITSRIGFDLDHPAVDAALVRLSDRGRVVPVDLAGSLTWKATP